MKKKTPFSHVTDIYKSNGTFGGDEGYAQFIINKELSKNGEVIDVVNLVQQYSIPNELHFKVMNSLFPYSNRPGFNKFPWIWKGSTKANEDVQVIAKHYEESIDNSKVYHTILKQTKKGKEHIQWLRNIYGLENKK